MAKAQNGVETLPTQQVEHQHSAL